MMCGERRRPYLLAALFLLTCRSSEKETPKPAPAVVGSAPERQLVLYPSAPTAPWGEAQFFNPDSSRPKTHLDLGDLQATGGLTLAKVKSSIENGQNVFRHCHWLALADRPDLRGTVALEFEVGPKGETSHARSTSSDIADPKMVKCAVERVSLLSFPAADPPTRVSVTMRFSPG